MSTDIQPVRIFIAYAHEDNIAREQLRRQLSVLERRGHFQIFWDGLIKPGEHWNERLKYELHRADIFLLLVSASFLDSDYVHEVELPKSLAMHKEGRVEIFPVIIKACPWRHTELADFQCILYEGRPVEDVDGYAYVAELVAQTAKQINAKRADEAREKQAAAVRFQENKEAARRDDMAQTEREKALRDLSDHETWEFVEDAATEAAYRRYLNKYPRGWYIDQARAKLDTFVKKREDEVVKARVSEKKKRVEEVENDADKFLQSYKKDDPFADLMITIKGGSFDMGDTFNEDILYDAGPVHSVTVHEFPLCKYPVTQAQWKTLMDINPSYFKGDDLPVENINWNDVHDFIKKLNEKTGKKYRLPSEAEWEYAAREGGKKIRFGNGKDIADPKEINFNGLKKNKQPYSVSGENRKKTTPVNTFAPNSLGLHDMSGNVWEWCQDVWHDNYHDAPNDSQAWEKGEDSSRRAVRGGSYSSNPHYCFATSRIKFRIFNRSYGIGFRLAQ